MVMARVRHQHCHHPREGVGEGQHVIVGERERETTSLSLLREGVSTLFLLVSERGQGCIVVRERVSSLERKRGQE